jgi:hypothetical protein
VGRPVGTVDIDGAVADSRRRAGAHRGGLGPVRTGARGSRGGRGAMDAGGTERLLRPSSRRQWLVVVAAARGGGVGPSSTRGSPNRGTEVEA